MNCRVWLSTVGLLLLGIGSYTIPLIPISLPADKWPEPEFAAVKLKLESVAGKLRGLHYRMGNAVGHDKIPTYNLIADHGVVYMRRPLLGPWRFGTAKYGTWAFGIPCLLGMPFVDYDHMKETARITPANFEKFMEWASHAEINVETKSYKTSNEN